MEKAYQISNEELKKLQRIELEMLIELDRICRKHQVSYSLDGGTLLGAVRHKGFIPWDDDIDVIMLRPEYEKFRSACERELDQTRFFLQDYKSDPHYRWGYEKLRRLGTEHIRLGQESLKQRTGVFLDIFVADQVPDGFVMRRLHHLLCFCIRKTLYAPLGAVNAPSGFLRGWYRLLSSIPSAFVFHFRNWLAERSNQKKTELVSHYTLDYPKRCRYGMPRECFDEMTELEFEGRKFLGFQKADLYLRTLYGDYMKLPPVEERKPHLLVSKLHLIDVEL